MLATVTPTIHLEQEVKISSAQAAAPAQRRRGLLDEIDRAGWLNASVVAAATAADSPA